ncbi:SufE family protein [Citricoccus sp. NPDC055426]|uniref:SufE family protein n=1 Tax=Citricoccus sp. NPDC055426 TaxID=3155536 RepID=UPI003431596D
MSVPAKLQEIIDDFQAVPDAEKLELLLEFSDELPALPARYDGHLDEMEQVVECQTPLFLALELEPAPGAPAAAVAETGPDAGPSPDPLVRLFVSAPPEAPTTRGFASVLSQGLDGLPASEVLAVPEDLSRLLGLQKSLTPLRLRGMSALLGRIKRNISTQLVS